MILIIHEVSSVFWWFELSSKKWMILVTHVFDEEWMIQLNDIYQLDHNADNKLIIWLYRNPCLSSINSLGPKPRMRNYCAMPKLISWLENAM